MYQFIASVFIASLALASSTSSLASSFGIGPLASSVIDSVGASTGLSGFSTVTALQSYVSQLEAHAQNINTRLNIIRSNTTNKALSWIFTPLQEVQSLAESLTKSTKSLSNAGSALGSLHLLTTDRSQGLTNLSSSAASIAAAFLSAPATIASKVISSGSNTVGNIQGTAAAAASQYASRPAIKTGLNVFNAQLAVVQGSLASLQDLTTGWKGYNDQVVTAAQSLISGLRDAGAQVGVGGGVGSWASLLEQQNAAPDALSSLQLFITHTA